ncbi:hypothetical protein [Nocardia sp. NPDC005998]|uniref:hypothetical protein n=1 Tax=Nocardia sp. NPDC005998 TaxID=3156894 RepID=UPI0033A28524
MRTILLDEERKFDLRSSADERCCLTAISPEPVTSDDYHYLHDTHGLPRDLVVYLNTEAAQ